MVNIPAIDRLNSKTVKKKGCWNWTGAKEFHGYGQIWYLDRIWVASRLAYTLYVGSIPNGLHVLHSCDNPPCTNPKHLFLGTMSDNLRDCVRKGRHACIRRTHCPRGHPYNKENTQINKTVKGTGTQRVCKECLKLRYPRDNMLRKIRTACYICKNSYQRTYLKLHIRQVHRIENRIRFTKAVK